MDSQDLQDEELTLAESAKNDKGAVGSFCGTPLGFNLMGDRQPSVRYPTLGFGV